MRSSAFLVPIAVLSLVCLAAGPAYAQWDWSLGLVSIDIGDDLGDIIDDGYGLSLGATNRFSKSLAFEMVLDLSFHDTLIGPSADIAYTRYDIGLRFFPVSGSSLNPYASAGLALHFMNFTDYADKIDGIALYYGAGVEVAVSKSGALDFGVRFSDWKGDWSPGSFNVDATTTAIQALYRFKL